MRNLVAQAADLIAQAQHVVVFTGAGVSRESGLPTFRDALEGLWARYDPQELKGQLNLLNWWWRFVGWGFTQLYTNLAWSYDAVAWVVSRGHWQAWGEAALSRIEGTRVLEIGSGPGHLLATLAAEGYDVSAIDLSPQMVAMARRRLVRLGVPAGLVLGRAQALPWPDALFDSVVMAFPAGFAVEPATLTEIGRVLRAGGRLIIVDGARLREGLYGRLVNLAFCVTHGGGGELSSVVDLYEQAAFAMTCETQQWPDSSVRLLLGAKR